MRDATLEEQKAIQDNIDKISIPTGYNFWELLDDIGEIMDREIYSKFPQGEFLVEIVEVK